MYLPDDFSFDAWRGQCLTGRRDSFTGRLGDNSLVITGATP